MNMYSTYNLMEIKRIISEATDFEMLDNIEDEKIQIALRNLEVRLFDMFGIEED